MDIFNTPNLISRNVNDIKGSVLLICSYTPSIDEAFITEMSQGRNVYHFCPELCHLDVLGLKLTTVFRLGRVTDLTIITKDGSPHSIQIPFMVQEAAENAGFDKSSIQYFALEGGKRHSFRDLTIRKARHYSEIEKLIPTAKLSKVVQILRAPGGCKNDAAETYTSIIEHLKEEVLEIEQAVLNNDIENLKEEIGDVLFNLHLMCDISNDAGHFDMTDVTEAVADKMINGHEKVFEGKSWKY